MTETTETAAVETTDLIDIDSGTVAGTVTRPAKPAAKRVRNRKAAARLNPTAVASDVDGDGLIDVDPAAVEALILDLVPLDVALRAEGSSVVELLRHVARTSSGLVV